MKDRLVPKIRFGGFTESWTKRPLSETGKWRGGSTPSKADPAFWNGDIPWVSSGDVKELELVQTTYSITKDALEQTGVPLLPKDALILVTRSGILRKYLPVAILSREMAVNQDIKAVVTNGKADARFLLNVLINQEADIRRTCGKEGTTVESVDYPSMLKYEVALPTLPEQQKIVAFLGAVDRKIQQLKRKQALLEQYKKGVVQQLFSQELRFKREDGGEFPEWEEKRLGDMADVIMGQSPDSSSYNATGEGLPLIQGNADIAGRVTSPRQWTSQPTKTCIVRDIILSVRAPVGAVARSAHAACIGRGVCSIRAKRSIDAEYLYQLMIDFEPKWKGIEQGSTFTAISGEDVRDLKFSFPSLEEQSRIAGFLMALDAKVAGVAQAVAACQKWKKGLLQQMFV